MPSTSDAGKTNPEPEGKPQKKTRVKNSVKRWSMGTTMSIQLIAVAVLLIAVNVVAYNYGKQYDLTRQNSIALTDETINNLHSATVQDREREIVITAVINPLQFARIQAATQENIADRIKIKLQEYADKAKGKIKLNIVDAIAEPGTLQELSSQYNVKFNTSMLIIDARQETTPSEAAIAELKRLNPTLSEEVLVKGFQDRRLGQFVRILPITDLYIDDIDPNYNSQPFVALWKDEAALTTNIMRAIEGKPKKIYFLYDKCMLDSERGGKSPWQFVKNAFKTQNIQLKEISLSSLPVKNVNGVKIKQIPLDADGVALIAPQVDFTQEELLSLTNYWEARDGASLLITLDPNKHLPNLNNFLLRSRIKPNKDRIIRKEGDQVLVNAEVEFLQGPQVNGDLSGKSTTFGGASQSIEIRQTNANTLVEAFPLVKVNESWWGETHFGAKNPTYDPRSDSQKPLYLAAAVTRGQLSDQMTAELVSKLVIIGNSEFLSRNQIREEQEEYLSQIGAWLVGREPLMNIPQNPNYRRKVFIASAHRSLLDQIFIFFIPVGALIITGFVWNLRRA